MILAHALLRYDVKLVGSETKRYSNMEFAHMVSSYYHSGDVHTNQGYSPFRIHLETSCLKRLRFERISQTEGIEISAYYSVLAFFIGYINIQLK